MCLTMAAWSIRDRRGNLPPMKRASKRSPARAPRSGRTLKAMCSPRAGTAPRASRQTFEKFDRFAPNFFIGNPEKGMHQLGAVLNPARRNFIENVIGSRIFIGEGGKKVADRRL